MRIAITHPTDWPFVRRGTERFMNELAEYLASRGHDVTILSAKPGRGEVLRDSAYITRHHRRLWHPSLGKVGIIEAHAFLVTCLASLLRHRFDIIQCCSFTDAFAASLARRVTGTPFVFWVNGLPPRVKYYRSLSLGGKVFTRAIQDADEVINISNFTQEYVAENYGRRGVVIPVPVAVERFPLVQGRSLDAPEILCTASLDDARKGGRVLFRAFQLLKSRRPTARLRIAYNLPETLRREFLSLVDEQYHGDIIFSGTGKLEDLPRWYAQAAVSVLPSMWEPFGLVVIESLAAGTPVVGTRSGALETLLADPTIGRLFDPGGENSIEPTNAEGLSQAIDEAIELSRHGETSRRARQFAEQFSWQAVGPRFEEIYNDIVSAKRTGIPRASSEGGDR
ncbi:glycosyltransferase family 4 protein [bacterium]|nr:glycosyltransferase family 4 protein [bacterium]